MKGRHEGILSSVPKPPSSGCSSGSETIRDLADVGPHVPGLKLLASVLRLLFPNGSNGNVVGRGF